MKQNCQGFVTPLENRHAHAQWFAHVLQHTLAATACTHIDSMTVTAQVSHHTLTATAWTRIDSTVIAQVFHDTLTATA